MLRLTSCESIEIVFVLDWDRCLDRGEDDLGSIRGESVGDGGVLPKDGRIGKGDDAIRCNVVCLGGEEEDS